MRISDWSSDVCSSDLRHVDRDLIFADQVARVEQVVHRIQQEGDMVEPAALRLQDEGDVMRLVGAGQEDGEPGLVPLRDQFLADGKAEYAGDDVPVLDDVGTAQPHMVQPPAADRNSVV